MGGKFIVFEGVDGSGKGTMLAKTAEWLFNCCTEHDKIVLTREPTFSGYGAQIRRALKADHEPMTKAKQLLNLYFQDRKEHINKLIKPALQLGSIVLCDRYKYSTIAYQHAQGIPMETIIAMHKRLLVPDLVLILDVEPKTAMKRIRTGRSSIEKFEKDFFIEEIRQNYLNIKKALPEEPIRLIDANGEPEEVFLKVKKEIQKTLKT
ncbi:MAG: dTMP kinase [Candidatus Diapherotrites archaeon]